MKNYIFKFRGRLKGAIGIYETFDNVRVEAENLDTAILKLYDKYQDISVISYSEN